MVHASSNDFNLDNFAPDSGFALDAQLVASSTNYAFPSGVAIPYLRGSYYNWKGDGTTENALFAGGSYIRLPSSHRPDGTLWVAGAEIDDMTYRSTEVTDPQDLLYGIGGGFSFDCWVHVPTVATITDSHRYKIILANENSGRGHEPNQSTVDAFVDNARLDESAIITYETGADTDKVHGLVFGFRDAGGSTNTSGIELILAPTVSQNHSTGSHHSACIATTFSSTESISFNSAVRDVPSASSLKDLGIYAGSGLSTHSGHSILDTSAAFVHLAAVFNYKTDEVKIFLDSEELVASSFSTDFCGSSLEGDVEGVNIPSWVMQVDPNSTFGYNRSWESPNGQGPVCGAIDSPIPGFTPWIIGGGYNDSSPSGFLGVNTNDVFDYTKMITGASPQGGQHFPPWTTLNRKAQSGLNGHVGSFKMYARALTTDEVLKNFNAQKGFFKNILT